MPFSRSSTLAVALSVSATRLLLAQVVYTAIPGHQAAALTPAQPTDTERSPVTLDVRDSTVAYVVSALAHQSHLRIVFNAADPHFKKRITVHVVKTNVLTALNIALQHTGLAARMASDGETVLVRAKVDDLSTNVHLAAGIIMGHVTDSANGQGLAGAAVHIEGTKLSAVSSDSGNFTLRAVPAGEQVLAVRLFGYKPVARAVTVVDSEPTTVHIVMVPVPMVLSGVVTTAAGLQRRVEIGNDITTINVDSVIKTAPVSNLTDLLEARVPGLTVLRSSGIPGAPSRLRLRGAGSITGNNDPIILVDGVRIYSNQSDSRNNNLASAVTPVAGGGNGFTGNGISHGGYSAPSPLDQIDPNSIETIEVFKGPSASALYGSDAADGVIVITTKHGRAGPAHWDLALSDGVNYEPGRWPVNYYRFGHDGINPGLSSGGLCLWYDLDCVVDSVVAFQALNDPRYTVFSHGSDPRADLTVSGGVPTLRYSLTGSAAGDVGLLKLPTIERQRYVKFYGVLPGYLLRPDNYTTWAGSGSLTAEPNTQVQVTLTSSLYQSHQQQGSLQQAPAQLEGAYIDPTQLASTPLIQNDVQRATDQSLTSTNALTLNWRPRPWLPVTATAGLNTIQRTDQTYIPFGVNYAGAGCGLGISGSSDETCGGSAGDTTGAYSIGRGTSQDQTLSLGTTIPVRAVTTDLGVNYHGSSTADVTASTSQLAPGVSTPTTFPTTASNGSGSPSSFSQSASATSTYGWYIQPRLKIFNTYINPGFRLDGGSASGSNAGLTAFPKIDLSYMAIDPGRPRGVLTLLRPRLAFGYAGTQPAPADKLRLLNADSANVVTVVTLDGGATEVPIVSITSLGNTHLRPERSSELEGGLDLNLWHDRLQFTYTQYNKTRHDAIIPIPVATSVIQGNSGSGDSNGSFRVDKNIGEVENTGTDATMNAQLVESRSLSWSVNANFSANKNRVVRLNPGQSTILLNNGTRIEAGYPLFGQFAQPIISYADANHDGIIESSEVRIGDSAIFVGQGTPKYEFDFSSNLTLLRGALSINMTLSYQNGLTQDESNLGLFNLLPNTPGASLAAQAAVAAAQPPSLTRSGTDIGFLQTVNLLRFNNLSINYTVPKRVSTLFRVPHMTVALQGSNLGLHTNYRGLDPNVNAFSAAGVFGDLTQDTGQIPQPRTWSVRLNLEN